MKQNQAQPMNQTHLIITRLRGTTSGIVAFLLAVAALPAAASQDMYQPKATPGGISPAPWITSLTRKGTNTTLNWYGLEGSYNVLMTPTIVPAHWTNVANLLATTWANSMTMANLSGSQNFFRLSPINNYVGSGTCGSCHPDARAVWQQTRHASAYAAIANLPPSIAATSLVYRTVGYGWPSGFVSATNTPWLENVGCENCHGPGAAHVYGNHNLVQPAATIASQVCGGCHDGAMNPTYSEWTNSAHAVVTPDVASGFNDTTSGQSRMLSCGPCHSGAARVAMLQNYAFTQAGYITTSNAVTLPSGADARLYGQTCTVCHDPHSTNGGPVQLRNPLASTNFFSWSTALAGATNRFGQFINLNFNTQYKTNIQVCAQCHNARGAQWTDTSRSPHGSLQYNMLLGDVGILGTNTTPYQPSTHARFFTNQCVDCHVQTSPFQSEAMPANTGHQFGVNSFTICEQCHGPNASNLVDFAENLFLPAQTSQVTAALNHWAATKAPAALYAKYGNRAWEYTTPGTLSSGGSGPTTAEQALIPANIKKARFNVYLANNDAASGIHNPLHVVALCSAAISFVQLELNQ
jgi:hypothetical protein